jgi:hypothetical protein
MASEFLGIRLPQQDLMVLSPNSVVATSGPHQVTLVSNLPSRAVKCQLSTVSGQSTAVVLRTDHGSLARRGKRSRIADAHLTKARPSCHQISRLSPFTTSAIPPNLGPLTPSYGFIVYVNEKPVSNIRTRLRVYFLSQIRFEPRDAPNQSGFRGPEMPVASRKNAKPSR